MTWSPNLIEIIDTKIRYQERTDVISSVRTIYGRTFTGKDSSDSTWQIWAVDTVQGLSSQKIFAKKDSIKNSGFVHIWNNRTNLFDPAPEPPVIEKSVDLDGVNDYLDAGDAYLYDNNDAWSLSLWVKVDNTSAKRCFYSKQTLDAAHTGLAIYHDSSGKINLEMRAGGGQNRQFTFNSTILTAVWLNLLFTYNGTQNINGARIYLDSIVENTPSSGTVTATILLGQDAYFGRRGTAFNLLGNLDQITVWDKALSASEAVELYNSGDPPDPTSLSFAANLVHYYPIGEGDTFPTISDNQGVTDLTMINMDAGDFVEDIP